MAFTATPETVFLDPVAPLLDVHELLEASRVGNDTKVVEYYGGRFLESLADELTPELELFSDEVNSRLAPLVKAALHRLAEQAETAFDWSRLERYARTLQNLDQSHAEAYSKLVTALAMQGRNDEADQVRDLAREWTGLEIRVPSVQRESVDSKAVSPRFVGRVEEFATCRRWWEAAKGGRGGIYVLKGEAGIGKSRLAEQLLRLVAIQGGTARHVRCHGNERRIAYSCLAHVADALRDHVPGDADMHVRESLSLLIPDLVDNPEEVRRQITVAGASDRAFLHAFTHVLSASSQVQPIAIVVDDLQWADAPSLDLLASLGRQLDAGKTLLVAVFRNDEAPTAGLEALTQLAHGEIDLQGLKPSECASLAESLVPTVDRDTESAIEHCDGNPFLLTETLRDLATREGAKSSHHQGVTGLVRYKWIRLGESARRLAQVASALEQFARVSLARRIAGLSSAEVVNALADLCTLGIISADSDTGIYFKHDLVREVIYRSTPRLIRRAIHARAAELLSVNHKVPAAVVALHAYRGTRKRIAHHAALTAARDATELGAYTEASFFLNLARVCATNRGAWRDAAEAKLELSMYTGDLRRALVLARKLRPYFEKAGKERGLLTCEYCELQNDIAQGVLPLPILEGKMGDLVARAAELDAGRLFVRALRDLSVVLLQSGKMQELSNLIVSAVGATEKLDNMLSAELHSTAAIAYTFLGQYSSAVSAANHGVAAAEGADSLARASALAARGVVRLAGARFAEAEADYTLALDLIADARLPVLNALAINYGVLLIEQDRMADALQVYSAPELALHRWRVVWHANVALARYESGAPQLALAAANECVDAATQIGAEWARLAGMSIAGLIHFDIGDQAAGLRPFPEISTGYPDHRHCIWDPSPIVQYLCRAYVTRDRFTDALSLLDTEIARILPGNVLVGNKLMLERGRTLAHTDIRAALVETRKVHAFALDAGAHLLAKHASGLLDDLRLRLAD